MEWSGASTYSAAVNLVESSRVETMVFKVHRKPIGDAFGC